MSIVSLLLLWLSELLPSRQRRRGRHIGHRQLPTDLILQEDETQQAAELLTQPAC